MAELVLDVTGVTKTFGALAACSDVEINLRAGEIHAMIGPNGAGKSTLIKQIAGEQNPDTGTFKFNGHDISKLSASRRARAGLVRTFQISSLAGEFSALKNVMLAVQGASGTNFRFFRSVQSDKSLVEPAMGFLKSAGLEQRADRMASELSHGERRQLEIAVALAMRPKAFLLDEPMAGIGPGGSKVLTGILDELRQQAPILLVEHDMEAVFRLADRITVLVQGRNFATGTVAEIRASTAVREAYLGEGAGS